MSKEINLFIIKEFSLKKNFFKLIYLLLHIQSNSLKEALIINTILHIQILSSFYSKQINVFKPEKYKSDYILYIIQSIFRIKDLFINNYSGIELLNIIILILLIIFFFDVFIVIYKGYIYNEYNIKLLNFFIKIFIFFLYNISLDISFSQICFSKSFINPNFNTNIKCFGNNKIFIIIPVITIILEFSLHQIIRMYYQDTFFLSNSCFAKLFTYYGICMDINLFINSILLTQANFLTKEFFLIYNFLFSIFILLYYIKNYIYYNPYINLTTGIFHFIYTWTSIFCLFCAYIDFNEKGIAYIISCIIIGFIYYYLKNKNENKILYDISINNIKNENYMLIYVKTLTDLLIKYDNSSENKSFICGLIKILINEFKINNNEKIYIPLNDNFRNENLENIEDEVFLKYFIIYIYNYILSLKKIIPEIYLNLSHYYLKVIGNYCEAMYYCQKLFEYNLNYQQEFAFFQLKLEIEQALNKKLKKSNDKNISLENLNVSVYYQYENLSDNFLKEINYDIELSLKFWKLFRRLHLELNFKLNFNKIFKLSEKIQKTKKKIEKMWKELMKEYSGINEYFEFYNEYIIQINDDEIKKREFDSIKKKIKTLDENINNNYYSLLFNKNTGIILINKDKGTENIIKIWNKKIENIFGFNELDLKEKNINILMPKIYEKKHDKYIENYFRTGYHKYIEKKDFKTYAKDKNNSIIQIKLAIKLFPILNHNVIFAGIITKEDLNDIILVDENFNIQGMCSELKKNLNINNDYLFQNNDIPFYIICKKFINFYKMFLKNKNKDNSLHEIFNKKTNSSMNNNNNDKIKSSKRKNEKDNDNNNNNNIIKKEEAIINEQIQENYEINENFELEFEIKIPQFIMDYSNLMKNNKKHLKKNNKEKEKENINKKKEINLSQESEDDEIDDEENELLLSNISKKKRLKNKNDKNETNNTQTPQETPIQNFSINLMNLRRESIINNNNNILPLEKDLNKCEEEKIFLDRMEQMINYFKEEKYDELEDILDLYNKESKLEYKFNFTFDKYKYGDNDIAYIIRCIDNKKFEGESNEKSFELDSNIIKYRKKKEEAIKPLYEILNEEREEIIKYPEKFLKLLENEKYQILIESCKKEINKMSKIQGNHNNEIIHHDNSSQSSHSEFDNDLMIKNKISELRSNIFQTTPNYFTIKYLKLIVIAISLFTLIFSLIFLIFIFNSFSDLKNISLMNLKLFKSSLKIIELVGIIISLKALVLKKVGKNNINYLYYETDEIKNINDYYIYMINISHILYHELNNEFGYLNMHISEYLSEENINNIYWNYINISYFNELYIRNNLKAKELFPAALEQFLCNINSFLNKYNYTNINFNKNEIKILNKDEEYFFKYNTFLLIENTYINIIPDLINKINKIPDISEKYNKSKDNYIYLIIFIFVACQTVICILYFFLIRLTSISMSDILKKLIKIKFEKIEETLKKIEKFYINLKLFNEKMYIELEENENKEEIKKENNFINKKRNSVKRKNSINFNPNENNNLNELSYISNNGFNSEQKNYYPLTILRPYFFHCLIFIIILGCFIIPIYIYSLNIIKSMNQLILIVKFIYGKLIYTSLNILDLKCYIIECNINNFSINYNNLGSNDKIQDFVKNIKNFKEIQFFYDNKFMLNACDAAINKENEINKYIFCLNDLMIKNANNTDNILQLIKNFIENVYKKDEMIKNEDDYFRQKLFNYERYQLIEYLFFNYVFNVDNIFEIAVINSLNDYIKKSKFFLIFLVISFSLIMIFYNFIYLIILTPKLIYLISISKGIIKLIPTSVIMNTPELQTWIGNKY